MKIENIASERKTGRILFSGREIIIYSLDIPKCENEDSILNELFVKTAENYLKYLEGLAEKELIPALKIMLDGSARAREIRREIGLPINASLNWKTCFFKEKYLSLRCEGRLIYANEKRIFTLRTLNLDSENTVMKKARQFSKKAPSRKKSFYIQGSKLYVYDRNFAVCDSAVASLEDMMKIRSYKIDNI